MTSEEPLDGRCNAQTRDGGYCTQWPVTGSERCRMHGGTAKKGRDHPQYKHGGYSKHLMSDLSDREQEAYESLVETLESDDPEDRLNVVREALAEAYMKYKRSGDVRFLREVRQLAETFNLVPNKQEVEHSGSVDGSFSVNINHTRVTDDESDE